MKKENYVVIGNSYVSQKIKKNNMNFFYIGRHRNDMDFNEFFELPLEDRFNVEEYEQSIKDILDFCKKIQNNYGTIHYVLANTEQTLLVGAIIRDTFCISGRRFEELIPFRNKFIMQEKIFKSKVLKKKKFISGDNVHVDFIKDIVRDYFLNKFPIVIKPCSQAGSRNVFFVNELHELINKINLFKKESIEFLLEEFISDSIIHIDGVYRNGELKFIIAFRYIKDCLSWHKKGTPMSSIIINDNKKIKEICRFTKEVLRNLNSNNVVFHLEAFMSVQGELTFLEIGARPGGAAIVPCVKKIFGVDLLEESLKIELNQETSLLNSGYISDKYEKNYAGWTVLPLKEKEYCVIENIYGLDKLPKEVKWLDYVDENQEFNKFYFEDPAIGKFVIQAESEDEVIKIINNIENDVFIKAKKIHDVHI
ncbi:ATP-grasp domain-containing protein [Photorhabdus viridis]|uniref:ATP-grasp domain-containing protein n=1 Tax=Photorhabdus viridis TaxID=3163327 RepID=UPI0033070B1E